MWCWHWRVFFTMETYGIVYNKRTLFECVFVPTVFAACNCAHQPPAFPGTWRWSNRKSSLFNITFYQSVKFPLLKSTFFVWPVARWVVEEGDITSSLWVRWQRNCGWLISISDETNLLEHIYISTFGFSFYNWVNSFDCWQPILSIRLSCWNWVIVKPFVLTRLYCPPPDSA